MPKPIKVHFIGDEKDLLKSFGAVEKKADGMGSHLKKAAGLMGAGLAAAGAAAVAFGAASIKAFAESEQVAAQTAAVIKSTGGAAKATADEVGALALEIQNYSGISDEAVQSGANMLLTFKNIKNEAGAGNDIFNQSVKILADMSTAMGTDMSSSAIQLGKALNDPIAGISALSRVGIQFTDDQKKAIERMVETNNIAGAQKLILAELESQFGGSAKAAGDTFAGQLNILKESFGGVQEAVGQMLVKEALPGLIAGFTGGSGGASDMGKSMEDLSKAIIEAGPEIRRISHDIGEFIRDLENAVGPVLNLVNAISKLGNPIQTIKREWNTREGGIVGSGPKPKNFHGIPGRAAGGPVTAGRTYLVGEKGPEVLTMGSNGHVTPNGSGGGQPIHLNVITFDQIETEMVNRLQRRKIRGA